MSFYEIASSYAPLLHGSDRRAEDVAARARLRVKLAELKAAGVALELPMDDDETDGDVLDILPRQRV